MYKKTAMKRNRQPVAPDNAGSWMGPALLVVLLMVLWGALFLLNLEESKINQAVNDQRHT